jgi:hypothetical protein
VIPPNLGPIGALVAAAAYSGATPDVLRTIAAEAPKSEGLMKGAWVLCDGCANGVHTGCRPPCHCDLCGAA